MPEATSCAVLQLLFVYAMQLTHVLQEIAAAAIARQRLLAGNSGDAQCCSRFAAIAQVTTKLCNPSLGTSLSCCVVGTAIWGYYAESKQHS